MLGLLSHQLYKPSKNSIDEFGPGTILNGNYTIVVPGRDIQNVIEKVLTEGRSPDWNFEEFANSNAKTKEIVGSGNLVFTTQIDPVDQEIETFEVSYSKTPKSQTVRYKDGDGLFDSFEQALLANPSKNLNILAFREKSFGGFPKFESYSLTMQSMAETFLTITVWGDPVIVIGTPDENQVSNDVDVFSKKLESLNCKMKSGASSSAKFDVEALCVYIRRVQLALKNTGSSQPQWKAVKPSDIDTLLRDHSVAWLNVSDSVELKSVLNEVRSYLKPITL